MSSLDRLPVRGAVRDPERDMTAILSHGHEGLRCRRLRTLTYFYSVVDRTPSDLRYATVVNRLATVQDPARVARSFCSTLTSPGTRLYEDC